MVKTFTTNKNNKIELTKEELKQLLDEAYWEGYRANDNSWIYTTPYSWIYTTPYTSPFYYSNEYNTTSGTNITLSSSLCSDHT